MTGLRHDRTQSPKEPLLDEAIAEPPLRIDLDVDRKSTPADGNASNQSPEAWDRFGPID
jgi:hypothetical protein